MKQILVDMDGVLADIYAHLIAYEYRESGILLNQQELNGKLEGEAFPSFEKVVRSKGFFRTAPVMEYSVEGLNYLNNKYKVLIVSSATEFPDSLTEKLAWLNEHFPFISWKQMIFCGSKDSICGDIMIDDHIKNLGSFPGRKILYTQPQNALIQDPSLERVNTWQEIVGML
ncbi:MULTISPECIES: 5'(3')-deoxyribonucleotidase [unclassified Parabacteroides]|uniref:5' nucleotidase, NT5C type n=1 Tax=unclassified Parabacteroides TaxID=2649774 RepID=UPI00247302A8|nr:MULTISPECIES: 5'(3')-deoxyribonucleotidase [unclassified Parabacteroides]